MYMFVNLSRHYMTMTICCPPTSQRTPDSYKQILVCIHILSDFRRSTTERIQDIDATWDDSNALI